MDLFYAGYPSGGGNFIHLIPIALGERFISQIDYDSIGTEREATMRR